MSPYFTKTYQRGFGTFPLKGDAARAAFETAVEVGYRAFDTAQMYENEAELGASIAATGIARDDFLITTKVKPANFTAADFMPSVEASLEALGLDTVDVLLLHWPPGDGNVAPSLEMLAEAEARGFARHVGVSNYTVAMLQTAIDVLGKSPVCNQVEFHPLLDQTTLLTGAAQMGVNLSAYCSVARGEVFKHPLFAEIGEAIGATAGQVVQRWILQKGVAVNTMSQSSDNIRANFGIMDISIGAADMVRIDALAKATNYRIVDKSIVPWAPVWDV